ncbi:MAG: hypothetical protein GY899_02510 [Verrucomicrobiaceae bacterium]|nr:hypothetical protein [Verrucomicrobiaceae bacterium]
MKKQLFRLKALFKPAEFSACELLVMRLLFALVVWAVIPERIDLFEQAAPVGMAKWFGLDFTFLSNPEILTMLRGVLFAALVLYCSGRLLFVALPVMLFMTVSCGTLINSQKAATHSTQIIALCVMVQCAWHLYAAFKHHRSGMPTASRRLMEGRMAVWYTQQMIATAYIVTAITKWLAKGSWIADSRFFPLQIVKSQRMDYYNSLQPQDQASGSYGIISDILAPFALWMEKTMMSYPGWAPVFLAPGFLVELLAVLLLAGRKIGGAYAVILIIFHLTIAEMMNLRFVYHIFVLGIFFSGMAFWLARGIEAIKWPPRRNQAVE